MIKIFQYYPTKVRVFRKSWQLREELGERAFFVALNEADAAAVEGKRWRQRYWSAVAVEVGQQLRRRAVVAQWMRMNPDDAGPLIDRSRP